MVGRPPSGTMATIALKASPHMSWRRTARGGMFAMGAFVLAGGRVHGDARASASGRGGRWSPRESSAPTTGSCWRISRRRPQDSALAPIVVEAVRAAMSQSSAVHLVPQTDIAGALQQMKQPKDTRLNDAALVSAGGGAHQCARRCWAAVCARAGTGYAVSLELTSAAGRRRAGVVPGHGRARATCSRWSIGLSRKLRGKVGESLRQVQRSVPLERATTSSLEALRKYSDAVRRQRHRRGLSARGALGARGGGARFDLRAGLAQAGGGALQQRCVGRGAGLGDRQGGAVRRPAARPREVHDHRQVPRSGQRRRGSRLRHRRLSPGLPGRQFEHDGAQRTHAARSQPQRGGQRAAFRPALLPCGSASGSGGTACRNLRGDGAVRHRAGAARFAAQGGAGIGAGS